MFLQKLSSIFRWWSVRWLSSRAGISKLLFLCSSVLSESPPLWWTIFVNLLTLDVSGFGKNICDAYRYVIFGIDQSSGNHEILLGVCDGWIMPRANPGSISALTGTIVSAFPLTFTFWHAVSLTGFDSILRWFKIHSSLPSRKTLSNGSIVNPRRLIKSIPKMLATTARCFTVFVYIFFGQSLKYFQRCTAQSYYQGCRFLLFFPEICRGYRFKLFFVRWPRCLTIIGRWPTSTTWTRGCCVLTVFSNLFIFRFYWIRCREDVESWCKKCTTCQSQRTEN